MPPKRDRSGEYARRKARCIQFNLCFRCLHDKGSNKWWCDGCLEKANMKDREDRKQNRLNGLCGCSAPKAENCNSCEKCLQKGRDYQSIRRAKHREIKGCITCGGGLLPGYKTCPKCQERATTSTLSRYNTNKTNGKCPFCGNDLDGLFRCNKCHERHIAHNRIEWHRNRQIVHQHYGDKCKCCGEKEFKFLEIDHVNNDGIHHRKLVHGRHIYRWAIRSNFPTNLQLLCANCNRGRAKFGVCPHHKLPEYTIKDRRKRHRLITHYGGVCRCCDEPIWAFLEFDHVDNNGNLHRQSTKRLGIMSWIIANNYPDSIQLLCSNCNKAKGLYGICPHQLTNMASPLSTSC